VASNGYCWSSEAVGGASQNSYNLNFNSGTGLNRANNNNRANGFGVRCVKHLPHYKCNLPYQPGTKLFLDIPELLL